MLVELGNPSPVVCASGNGHSHESLGLSAPAVTYFHIPDTYTCAEGADVRDIALHLAQNPDITRLPDHEAHLMVIHPTAGGWLHHGAQKPSWAWSDNAEIDRFLREYYDCAERPVDVEDTHQTRFGPPGVGAWAAPIEANITQNGRDLWAQVMGGGSVGYTGLTNGTTATTLTATGTPWSASQWIGYRVFASVSGSAMAWANVISNTTSALTVDRWYTPSTPGGSVGSTPSPTGVFVIADGGAPAWFMGLTNNNSAPASPSTATSLTGEIATVGGGLVRQICTWGHTASANTYTLQAIFTANGTDALPITINKIGVFNSMVVSDTGSKPMLFETLLNVAATLSASGDQLTVTETVTGT